MHNRAFLVGCLLALGLLSPTSGQDPAPSPIDFATQIQPLLARSCHKCHGPDHQKGGLRLDRRDAALRGGDAGVEREPPPGRRPKARISMDPPASIVTSEGVKA
jgi:mono/diheme cytochrome c family protein